MNKIKPKITKEFLLKAVIGFTLVIIVSGGALILSKANPNPAISNELKNYNDFLFSSQKFYAICTSPEIVSYLNGVKTSDDFSQISSEITSLGIATHYDLKSFKNLNANVTISDFNPEFIKIGEILKGQDFLTKFKRIYLPGMKEFVYVSSTGYAPVDSKLLPLVKNDNNCPTAFNIGKVNIPYADMSKFDEPSLSILDTQANITLYFWDDNDLFSVSMVVARNNILSDWHVFGVHMIYVQNYNGNYSHTEIVKRIKDSLQKSRSILNGKK